MAYKIVAVLLIVIASILWLDYDVALFFHNHSYPFFSLITHLGNAVPYLLAGLGAYLFFRKSDPAKAKKGLFLFTSVIVAGLITTALKILISRPRPKLFFSEHLTTPQFFELKGKFWSMPSGHTTTAFAAMVSLGLIFPKYRYIFWFLALLVAASRVVLAQHYISDVLIGALIGTLSAVLLYKRMGLAK
ncbi:phosphatase PAP2 family protein [Nitratiruptor tergarcus]|uniref:PAP2 superfamily protein n=1 Tax=Nitratiruptor tergarcus DSM 16512 TaxID=1069081 RepID=A0A1W1WV66_9BACT|nr:phosphatase PAP2 family protein [Nitratiruptor tergarcus]SMC10136.1 PAP2 superfamily protein [Nitratiruptor tergarcus DSM 16512]